MILSTYLIGLIDALSAFANSEFLNEFNIENVALGSSVSCFIDRDGTAFIYDHADIFKVILIGIGNIFQIT